MAAGQNFRTRKEHLEEATQSVWVKKSKREKSKRVAVSALTWRALISLASDIESGHLFRASKTNLPLKSFDEAWWKVLKKAKIENFHFHDLRACAATILLSLGVDSISVRDILGPANIETTQIYTRIANEKLRGSVDKWGRISRII